MFRLRKHRAKLREMLHSLGIYKLKCPDQDKLGHECSQNCDHTIDIILKDEAVEENWIYAPNASQVMADMMISAAEKAGIYDTPQFDLSTCKNGTTQCLIPIKCTDAGRCPYAKQSTT